MVRLLFGVFRNRGVVLLTRPSGLEAALLTCLILFSLLLFVLGCWTAEELLWGEELGRELFFDAFRQRRWDACRGEAWTNSNVKLG